jgi:hypothetical protein
MIKTFFENLLIDWRIKNILVSFKYLQIAIDQEYDCNKITMTVLEKRIHEKIEALVDLKFCSPTFFHA